MAFKFLKTGADAAKLAKRAQEEAEARRAAQNKMFRFWLKEGEEARITFVDGDLATSGEYEGYPNPPRYFEHNLYLNGSWNNFFYCPQETNPDSGEKCPICESGDKPKYVALFTVLDHRQFQSKDKTKIFKDTKRLFVAKPQTLELLTKQAIKRKGLAGCTFEVSRVGDKSASVGSMFDFVEKKPVEELQKIYLTEKVDPKTNQKIKVTNFTPADYEKEITFFSGDQLKKAVTDITDVPFDGPGGTGAPADYGDQL